VPAQFAPFFVMKWNMIIQGVFLWATGPFLAHLITPNLQEQASIWCFFSIAQIGFMIIVIRDQLIMKWGRNAKTDVNLQWRLQGWFDIRVVHTKNGKVEEFTNTLRALDANHKKAQ
jgi:hypothetical protein